MDMRIRPLEGATPEGGAAAAAAAAVVGGMECRGRVSVFGTEVEEAQREEY